jgi:hypothetical protein
MIILHYFVGRVEARNPTFYSVLSGFVPHAESCRMPYAHSTKSIHSVDLDLQYIMTICQLEMV